jgi:hypothetical protein
MRINNQNPLILKIEGQPHQEVGAVQEVVDAVVEL